jgi:hypothetical protein
MKTCTKCGETKALSEFYVDKARPDGKRNYCSVCDREKSKRYRELFPEKSKQQVRSSKLKTKYNIDLNFFEEMVSNQDNKCAICKTEFWDPKYTCVDHCHKTKKVRAILCGPCNTGLGLFKESTQALKNAIKYLEKHQ